MIKLKVGSDHVFRWVSPDPVLTGTTPSLRVSRDGVVIAGLDALAPIVAPQSVTAIVDRKVLTIDGELLFADAAYAQHDWGSAFYVSQDDSWIPVKVQAIDITNTGTQVTLASILPSKVSAGGVLQFATWFTSFTSDDVTSEVSRRISWDVTYSPLVAGEAAGTANQRSDNGRIYVVNRLFETGLTTSVLHTYFFDLADSTPGKSTDRQGPINFTKIELIQDLRTYLKDKGPYTEDDVDGQAFLIPHSYLTASFIFERTDPDRADKYRERYDATMAKALECVWVDLDRDGEIDENESSLNFTPSTLTHFRRAGIPAGRPTWRIKNPLNQL